MTFTNKYYISDSHFGHEAIIGSCSRPFSSVEQMDVFMVQAWNNVVSDNDIIYHLGDFAFGGPDHAKHIFQQLNGKKILVLGNHDVDRKGNPLSKIASLEWYQPPVQNLVTNDGGERLFLSHYAHRVWPSSNKGSYHFYGHSHARLDSAGLSRDVGVDMDDINFTPRSFNHLKASLPGLQTFLAP